MKYETPSTRYESLVDEWNDRELRRLRVEHGALQAQQDELMEELRRSAHTPQPKTGRDEHDRISPLNLPPVSSRGHNKVPRLNYPCAICGQMFLATRVEGLRRKTCLSRACKRGIYLQRIQGRIEFQYGTHGRSAFKAGLMWAASTG